MFIFIDSDFVNITKIAIIVSFVL